jgi:hypothetical protein
MVAMAIINRDREKQKQNELDKKRKGEDEKDKLLAQVRAVISKKKSPEQWSLEEWTNPKLEKMCLYYKHNIHKSLPTCKSDVFKRYQETRHRRTLNEVGAIASLSAASPTEDKSPAEDKIMLNDSDDDEKAPLPFVRTTAKRQTCTHQKKRVAAAEKDNKSDDEGGMILGSKHEGSDSDSESHGDDDDLLDNNFFPKLSDSMEEVCYSRKPGEKTTK